MALTDARGDAEPESLRDRLVAVTTDAMLQPRGMRMPTMREIATRAGVSPGAAYRHFESQEHLLLAVVSTITADLEATLKAAAGPSNDPTATTRALAHAYVTWGVANPGGYQLLFETTDDPTALALGQRPGQNMIGHIALLLGRIDGARGPQVAAAMRLWTLMHGLVSLRTHKTGAPWLTTIDDEVEQSVAMVVATVTSTARSNTEA